MYIQQEQKPPLVKRVIWHPFLIGIAFIFYFWSSTATSPFEAVRSVAVAILGTLLLLYLLRLGLRSWRAAGIATSALWLLLISKQGLMNVSQAAIENGAWRAVVLSIILLAVGFFALRGFRSYLRRSYALAAITNALNIFASILLAIVIVTAAVGGRLQTPSQDVGQAIDRFMAQPPSVGSKVPVGPDIYVFILDAYARADTLASYGFDNSAFLKELEDRGFDVAYESRSNYHDTALTLPSMLNMEPVQSLPAWEEITSGRLDEDNALRGAINRNKVFTDLYDYGYRSAATATLAGQTTIHGAYDYLDSMSLNGFELELLRVTGIMSAIELVAPDFTGQQVRQRVLDNLQLTRGLALDPRHRPRLIIAHLTSPHSPMAFGAGCEPHPLPHQQLDEGIFDWPSATEPAAIDEVRSEYINQLTCVNKLIVPVIDDIFAGVDQPPVIIVMSDHGPLLPGGTLNDRYANLFAAYTPGHKDLFSEDTTPLNLFPTLLNAYLGTDYPGWPNTSWQVVAPNRTWVEVPAATP